MLSIISGGMDTINAESEKNFPALRAQYERQDPYYCTVTEESGAVRPATDEECREKIRDDVESNFLVVGLFGLLAAIVMTVSILYTFKMIKVVGREAPEGCASMMIKQTASTVGMGKGVKKEKGN